MIPPFYSSPPPLGRRTPEGPSFSARALHAVLPDILRTGPAGLRAAPSGWWLNVLRAGIPHGNALLEVGGISHMTSDGRVVAEDRIFNHRPAAAHGIEEVAQVF